MTEGIAARMAADRHVLLHAHEHGGLDDLHTELDKSPVHEAARENDLACLHRLIEADGKAASLCHARDKYGFTPLHWAAERGHADAVSYLLTKGADANSVETRLFRRTPLHLAAVAPSLEAVRVLLANGASSDAVEYRGWTALHYAAHAGAIEILQVLLASGCDSRRKTLAGETAHDIAVRAGHADAAQALQ